MVTMPETSQPPRVDLMKRFSVWRKTGKVVDEVDRGVVCAIVTAGADVVEPTGVGIRDVLQVLPAVAGAWIDGARQSVEGAQG